MWLLDLFREFQFFYIEVSYARNMSLTSSNRNDRRLFSLVRRNVLFSQKINILENNAFNENALLYEPPWRKPG